MNSAPSNRNAFTLVITLILLLTFNEDIYNQPLVIKENKDHFKIIFKNLDSDSIRILQLTDLHLGSKGKWKDDLNTFKRIMRLVETFNPELIFITGDLFTGEKPYGSLLVSYTAHYFDQLKRPWFYTFGNHDPEGGFGRDDIYTIFSNAEWGILGYHESGGVRKYDYYADIIYDADIPIWQVFGFDTGPHNGMKATQPDQISWYEIKSLEYKDKFNKQIPAISFFHIPLIQYQELWDDNSISKQGVSLEKVYFEEDDGSLYNAFVEMGNVKATFCGHDHYNNYWGKTKNDITLSYGYISGESTNEAWPTGGKLISLPLDHGEIFIKNVIPVFHPDDHKY